jgi:hypothetical protein
MPANEVITCLSVLHIAFQPVAINAFAMALVAGGVRLRTRVLVYSISALASPAMLLQLYLFDWAGTCRIGDALCGETLCTRTGTWHLACDVPYNGPLVWVDEALGTRLAMPTYVVAAFGLPLLHGARRFVLAHLVVGPVLAIALTTDPNEMPAIWCLFSIAIIAIGLIPWLWRRLEVRRRRRPERPVPPHRLTARAGSA